MGYVKYMNNQNSGLIQEKEVDGLVFKVRYLTPELMALNDLKTITPAESDFNARLKEYAGLDYYNVTVGSKRADGHVLAVLEDEGIDPVKAEDFLNFNMQANIQSVEGADTGKCVLYLLSKTYGLSKEYNIQAGLDVGKHSTINDKTFEMNTDLLNRGLLKFRFKQEDIDRIPSLTF